MRRLSALALAAISLLLATAAAGSASSYSIGLIAPWGSTAYDGGAITVTYSIVRVGPGVPASAQADVENALTAWNSCFAGSLGCSGLAPTGKFSFVPAAGKPMLAITIKKGGGIVAGSTKLRYDRSGFIKSARLQISASSFGRPNTDAAITEIATHELGHVVGLGHSTDPNDLMYPTLNNTSTFGSCEVHGFDALYSRWLGSSDPAVPTVSSVDC